MSSVASSANVSQDGWLSDDEPPKDRIGDLHPLQLNRQGNLSSFKQILKLGTTIPTAFSPLDSITLKYIDCRQFSQQLRTAIPDESLVDELIRILPDQEQCASYYDLKKICPLGCEALRYMKIGEICTVWTEDREGIDYSEIIRDRKLSSILQSKRRKFARANAETKAWDLVGSKCNHDASIFIQLISVTSRTAYGNLIKTILKQPSSWQTPSENSQVTFKVQRQPGDKAVDVRLKPSELKSENWRHLLRSFRLGEESQIEINSNVISEEPIDHSLMCDNVSIIELIEICTTRFFKIPLQGDNAGGIFPLDNSCGESFNKTSDLNGAHQLKLETIQTLDSAGHDERYRTYGGSDLLKSGDFVILAILGSGESKEEAKNIALHVSRSKAVPEWFHGLLKHCRFGVKYHLSLSHKQEIPGRKDLSSTESDISNCVLKAIPMNQRSFSFRKLLGQGDTTQYVQLQDYLLHNIVIPDDLLLFEKDGAFPSERAISWDQIMPADQLELTFIATAQCGQEVNPWQSDPNTVLSHAGALLAEATRVLRDGELLARCNNWSIDSLTFIKQLSSRAIDKNEIRELSSHNDLLASQTVDLTASDKTMQDVLPDHIYTLSFIAAYLRSSVCYLVEDWRELLSTIKTHAKLEEKQVIFENEALKTLLASLISMKAKAEFCLKLYDECSTTCTKYRDLGLPDLVDLEKVAAEKMEQDLKRDKELYSRMFR